MIMRTHDVSLQLTGSEPEGISGVEKGGYVLLGLGVLAMIAALAGAGTSSPLLFFVAAFGFTSIGGLMAALPRYLRRGSGIRHNDIMTGAATHRGSIAWTLGVVITGFYILLYWYPDTLVGLTRTTDPLSRLLRGKESDQWFLYGTMYTLAVLVMGMRMLVKYRHSRYQIFRTISVMFFQLVLAFLVPAILQLYQQPEFYFSYFWPLKPDYFFPDGMDYIEKSGGLGVFMIRWAMVMSFVATPIFTYFFGKRWYCSWVCGCGGLAETAGDPWRQLSSKKLIAWKIERWMIHTVLLFVTVTTALLWINSATDGGVLGGVSGTFSSVYGFAIGSVFSGVIGVGFYPLMGARVWCRFGCPMAAVLGILQKYASRFRITTNGGQCISCGNCSTYCEMGIDVRAYAQRGENIVRASCVGCGVCSAVCPRGVLNLEVTPRTRTSAP